MLTFDAAECPGPYSFLCASAPVDSRRTAIWRPHLFQGRISSTAMSLTRVRAIVDRPRSWVLLADVVARGAGFTTTFLLARFSGSYSVGEYSRLVNTASTVIQPFLQVMANNSTVLAVDAVRENTGTVRRVALGNLLLSFLLSMLSFPLFILLYGIGASGANASSNPLWLGLVAAISVITGQLCGAVLLGSHFGTNQFVVPALVAGGVAVLGAAAAIPAVLLHGVAGAYVVLAVTSVATPLALAFAMFRGGNENEPRLRIGAPTKMKVVNQFWVSWPSVTNTAVGAFVYWMCTIYFVQRSFGTEGVGLIAVSMQWLTIMLLAPTSWGRIALKTLAEAVASGSAVAVRDATLQLVKRNVLVAAIVSIPFFLGATWIASFYGLGNSELDHLGRLNAIGAMLAAVNIVIERLLLCLNRQQTWFLASLARYLVQVFITAAFIQAGLQVVILASLAGTGLVLLLFLVSLDKIIGSALAAQK